MYMNLKPNQKRKRIPFNTTTMTSSRFIAPLKFSSHPNLIFLLRAPKLFCSEIFRSPPIIRGATTMLYQDEVSIPFACSCQPLYC